VHKREKGKEKERRLGSCVSQAGDPRLNGELKRCQPAVRRRGATKRDKNSSEDGPQSGNESGDKRHNGIGTSGIGIPMDTELRAEAIDGEVNQKITKQSPTHMLLLEDWNSRLKQRWR
jgi:hypothetical protein